jgi:hypothetical protein
MVKSRKRNISKYRTDLLCDFLIELDKYIKENQKDANNNKYIFVSFDESYINKNHASTHTCMGPNTKPVNRGTSKGARAVILDAITPDSLLCECIGNIPIDDNIWENDIPRTQTDCDDKLWTCEMIWKANISTGDYHNNMNSENFMNWAVNRFLPTFKQMYPDKVMVLIIDNAPYHHKHAVVAFGSKTKKQLVDLAVKHKVEYIELPFH